MNSLEINAILGRRDYCTKNNFLGVFPNDHLPIPRRDLYNQFLVYNLNNSNQKGSHWIAITLMKTND